MNSRREERERIAEGKRERERKRGEVNTRVNCMGSTYSKSNTQEDNKREEAHLMLY